MESSGFFKISIWCNKLLFGKEQPLCYTAYDKKSVWYKIFDAFFFWQKNHCRKVFLSRKIHNERRK